MRVGENLGCPTADRLPKVLRFRGNNDAEKKQSTGEEVVKSVHVIIVDSKGEEHEAPRVRCHCETGAGIFIRWRMRSK